MHAHTCCGDGGGGGTAKAAGVVLSPSSPGFPGPFVRKEFVEFLLKKKIKCPVPIAPEQDEEGQHPPPGSPLTLPPLPFALCPGVAMVLPRPGAGAQALGWGSPQPGARWWQGPAGATSSNRAPTARLINHKVHFSFPQHGNLPVCVQPSGAALWFTEAFTKCYKVLVNKSKHTNKTKTTTK